MAKNPTAKGERRKKRAAILHEQRDTTRAEKAARAKANGTRFVKGSFAAPKKIPQLRNNTLFDAVDRRLPGWPLAEQALIARGAIVYV